jgi:hypothetical protein
MHFLKKFGVLAIAVLALSVVGVANASAASQFTASATGTLEGKAENNQVFTAASGSPAVVCTAAHTTGSIVSLATPTQEVTVVYSGCTIPGLFNAPVDNITATYELHAGNGPNTGTVTIVNNIVINATGLGCSTTVAAGQTVGTLNYTNINSNTEITQESNVTGLKSTSTGLCPSGTTGTYTGNNIVHRVGGGFVRWDS